MARHHVTSIVAGGASGAKSSGGKEHVSVRDIGRFLHRNWFIIIGFTVLSIGAGAIYIVKSTPIYQSTTRLVMDPEQGRIASQDAFSGTIIIESAEIASQVEIVKSAAIARSVIDKLDLRNDPELVGGGGSLRSMIQKKIMGVLNIFGSKDDGAKKKRVTDDQDEEENTTRLTMSAFLSRVSVARVGQSYILEIGYASIDPDKAARIANAIADAYIQIGLRERAAAAQSGAKWLETRLVEVGRQAREAAMAAEDFRAKNGIMDIGRESSLDQQQLSEISSQALSARSQTAAEQAKLDTLSQMMNDDTIDGNVAETVNNPRIQKLEEDINTANAKLADLTSRYEPGNPAIVAAQTEIARLQTEIAGEFTRVQDVYRSNVTMAEHREKLLEAQLKATTQTGTDKNLARVELSELESRATTYRRMYESILQQLIGALQKQSFPLGNARVVTAATAPLSKTWPKSSLILSFAGILGLSAGFGVGLLRDGMDRRIGGNDRLRRELGIGSLGKVPVGGSPSYVPVHANANSATPADGQSLRFVLDMPYSRFSESLRGVKSSLDSVFAANAPMVVGITSVGAGEGKTTIATNLAQLYQNEGTSVVLVDADFLNARLSRTAAEAGEELGLHCLQLAGATIKYVGSGNFATVVEPAYGDGPAAGEVPVLTVNETEKAIAPNQRYGHLPALKSELELLRQRYKTVIVDMSAFEESADTRVICSYLDGIVVVMAQSQKMTIERFSDALASFGKARVNLLGVVANRSDEQRRSMFRRRRGQNKPPSSPTYSSSTQSDERPGGRPLKIVVAVASTGRRDILGAVLPHISRQTRLPDEVIVCVASQDDIDSACLARLNCPTRVLISKRGLCKQRNHILDNVGDADIVLFLDDDFLMTPSYVEETERLFRAHHDIVMCTGTLIADGIIGPGISVRDGMRLVETGARRKSDLSPKFEPVYNGYGCNMAIRISAITTDNLRFDENLPAYGWLEDVDFSRLIAHRGQVVSAKRLEGVHLGVKVGRTPGVRFGYSQIANPIYLMRKRTMSLRHAGVQMSRNIIANLVKIWKPEPWVDRRGRLRGNALACMDLLKGKLAPQKMEALE